MRYLRPGGYIYMCVCPTPSDTADSGGEVLCSKLPVANGPIHDQHEMIKLALKPPPTFVPWWPFQIHIVLLYLRILSLLLLSTRQVGSLVNPLRNGPGNNKCLRWSGPSGPRFHQPEARLKPTGTLFLRRLEARTSRFVSMATSCKTLLLYARWS